MRGYIVVKNALSSQQLDQLNEILDQKIAEGRWHIADKQHRPENPKLAGINRPGEARPQPGLIQPVNCRFGSQAKVGELLDWGPALTDLIDLPAVLTILHELCGARCRLDHDYINVLKTGGALLGLHGGGSSQAIDGGFGGGSTFYRYSDGQFLNGLLTVAYELKTVHPGDGGFACVSGSHKSNVELPKEWQDATTQQELNARETKTGFTVDRVACEAGSAIIFTEACKHGTLPWLGDGERRTVFMKYAAAAVAWSGGYYNASRWPWLTAQQAAMLEPPHVPNGRSWESASARSALEKEIIALREEVKALRSQPLAGSTGMSSRL